MDGINWSEYCLMCLHTNIATYVSLFKVISDEIPYQLKRFNCKCYLVQHNMFLPDSNLVK